MKTITVYGYDVSTDVQALLIQKMKSAPFLASDIENEAIRLGVPSSNRRECIAMRLADRLIQRERKSGNIELRRPAWVWVGNQPASPSCL